MNEYQEIIFAILRGEGVEIPKTGRIKILKPFMKRNGYINASGWWIKNNKFK